MTDYAGRRNTKLKPCPLCGIEASVTKIGNVYNIACGVLDDGTDTCGLVLFGGAEVALIDMINAWNRRHLHKEKATPLDH